MDWFTVGCLTTAAQVIIGAAGGHRQDWGQERKEIFQKAQTYQFMNSMGMIIGSLIKPKAVYSPYLFLIGTILFSGSLFHRAFTGEKDLSGKLPPFGGMAMIFGWTLLAFKK